MSKKEKSIGKWSETNDLEKLYDFDLNGNFFKNMFEGTQEQVPFDQVSEYIKNNK